MDQAISRYLLKLRRANPFLATISLLANYQFDQGVDLFDTDARTIRINLNYFNSISETQKTGLLLHLTLHSALLHPIRLGARNLQVWNIAADIVVNNIIEESGDFQPPEQTAVEPKFKDLSVEQVYEKLMSMPKKHPSVKQAAMKMPLGSKSAEQTAEAKQKSSKNNSQPNNHQIEQVLQSLYPCHIDLNTCASGVPNSHNKPHSGNSKKDSMSSGANRVHKEKSNKKNEKKHDLSQQARMNSEVKRQAEQTTQHWRNALRKAEMASRMAAKNQGQLPAGLMLELDQMMNPIMDWRWLLWRFVVRTPDDFEGFDRRFVHQGLYLDQLESNRLNVLVAVDTSGSIERDELTQFISELQGICHAYDFIKVELYYVDADIYGPFSLADGLDKAPPQGGGGTDFAVFYEQVVDQLNSNDVDIITYFTDGFGDFPLKAPSIETMWVVTSGGLDSQSFPFGEVARLSHI